MQDVFGMSCEPRSTRRPATNHPASNGGSRRFAYVGPTLAATVFAALILHLLVELASRFDSGDPGGAVSVLLGAAAVLVTLMPFAVLFALRARRAWRATMTPDARPGGPALVSGRR